MAVPVTVKVAFATAFSVVVAPAVAFVAFGCVVTVSSGELIFPRLSELPGFYVEAAPVASLGALLFAALLWLSFAHFARQVTRARVVALGALSFALPFAFPVIEAAVMGGRVSAVRLLIAALGTVAGAATGLVLPHALVPRAAPANDA